MTDHRYGALELPDPIPSKKRGGGEADGVCDPSLGGGEADGVCEKSPLTKGETGGCVSSSPSEGWALHWTVKRRHYYRNLRALCGLPSFGHRGPYDQDHAHKNNCGYCCVIIEREPLIPSKKRGGGEADGVCS